MSILNGFLFGVSLYILPVVFAFIAALSKTDKSEDNKNTNTVVGIWFLLGFLMTFFLLYALTAPFGIRLDTKLFYQFSALLILFFSMQHLNMMKLSFLKREEKEIKAYSSKQALFLGISFALGWSPLLYAQLSSSVNNMTFFIGLFIPFFIIAIVLDLVKTNFLQKHSQFLTKLAGVMMLILSFFLLLS